MRSFTAVLLVLGLFTPLLSCSSLPEKPIVASIAPRGVLERCVNVLPGQSLKYSWDSMEQVTFTIIPSRGGQAGDPIVRERGNTFRGVLEPGEETTYCFQWNNTTGRQVRVSFSPIIVK
jgi:hypothetical protein